MMDWNIRPSPDSSLQAKIVEFQGSHLEQHFPAASGFSQDNASTQKPYIYPGNNQIINISSSAIIADKMPLQNTGSSNALQPILPKLSKANKGFGPSKHLHNIPPVSLSTMFVQMTSGVTQNSNMRNVPSSHVVLQDGTINPLQNIPQKRANPYMAMENYNNQSQQINSNYVRMPVYQQGCKNSLSPRNQPTVPPYFYVNGPSISQAGATVPLNSSSSHYLNSQQNFSCTVLPIGQNSQNQINDQNPSMTATVQSQQYASDVTNIPYNMPTHCDKRNAIQISSYALPIQVTDKPPPPYQVPSVQTNYGQFSLPQPVANISNENVQNYHSPMPDPNTASYSAHSVQERQSVQITRETNAVGSIAYNVSEHGSGNQLSNESAKSSEFRDSFLSSVQTSTIVPADEASTPQASQTLEPQNKPSNVLVNFPDNSSKVKLKITKESLARDYKKINAVERVLLKLGEAYKIKRKIFMSTQKNKQASDPSDHSQNLSQSSCNVAQNEPSSVANPALQFPSQDANKNQSSLPASYDSNQIKAVPLLPQKTGSHLLPILRNLLEGTDDENMLLNAFFEKEVTHQNGQLAVDGSSSKNLSVTSGDKSEYSVNNTVSTSTLNPQISQMNLTQEPLSCIKNDVGLMQTSRTTSHQLEKVTAASGKSSFHHFKLNKDALETLRHFISCRLENVIRNPEKGRIESIHDSQSVSPISVQKHEKNIKTGDEHVYDASRSASLHSKRVAVVQETASVQNPTISADSFRNGGICSLEELKTSLDLWRKSLPASLNGQLHENTQSTGNLSSSEYGDTDKKMQQSLENPTSTFIQNDQAKFTSGSDETTQYSVPLSLGRSHDVVSSNLSKGSEPQVAIVTPLMLPKENIQIVLHKNSPSLEITCPRSEEGKVHSLQKFLSTLPQNDKEIQDTICLPRESVKYSKDYLEINQKALSTQENGKDEVEPGNKYSQELRQVVDNHSSLELKTLKSQLGSGDNCPPDNKVSKKCVQSHTGPNLVESRDTDEVVQNDAVLQISSVCTLVKGDAFYNSQIANIFSTSPLIPSMENNASLKDSIPCLQNDDQQSGILKTESEPEISISVSEGNALLPSPCTLTKAVEEIFKGSPDLEMSQSHKTSNEMNERNSEEGENSLLPEGMPFSEKKLEQNVSCSGVHCTDLKSNNQELCQNIEDRFGSSTGDGLCVVKEEEAAECVSAEENQKHSGSSTEAPVTLLSDQLSELSKEFPYGIGYLKSLNITGNNDPMPKLNNRGNTENKFVNIRDLEKRYGYKKAEHKRTYSELNEQQSEGTEHTKPIKRINLEKYAYSKDRKNAWKYRSSHLDNGKTLTPQKQRGHPPNRSKMCSPAKEAVLDANKREKWSERSLSDMKSCFNRRTSKLSMFLQREPKKTYLNRVAFRRTAHKTICLTSLEPSHSKSVWHVKSSSLSGLSKEKRKSSLPPQQPETEKPQMLQFKMCPDILFRNPVTEEQILNAAELPEKDRAPVTGMALISSNALKKRKALDLNSERLDAGLPSGNKGRQTDEEPATKSTLLSALSQVTEHVINLNKTDQLAASQLVSDQESQSAFQKMFISSSNRKTEGLALKEKQKGKTKKRPGKAEHALSPSTSQNQNPTISANSFRNGGTCSLEELPLWRKSLPASLSGQLHESSQSTGRLSSSEGGDNDEKTQQSLENPTSMFTLNDQAKVPPMPDETIQSSVPVSLSKKHVIVTFSLSKCSGPQVVIDTPLMLPKENVQMALHKNSPSLEITCPCSEEGRAYSLQKLLSTLPHTEKGVQPIMCSPSQSVKYYKNLHVHQKAVLSTQENRIVKVEPGKNYCHELIQKAGSHSLNSQLGSGDNLPHDKKVSKKCAQSQTGPDLVESKDNVDVVQISNVCTLVKGDAFYNSQIASIFSTSPLIPSMENNTSLKDSIPCLQSDDQQSGILKTESEPEMSISVSEGNALLPSPYTLSKADEEIFKGSPDLEMSQSHKTSNEMNERNSKEGENSLLPEVDDDIPLDTAIKLLDRNETFGMPLKDSQTTFETYRKMHLEKRSRSLDSNLSN
ncbi:hypothetical protein JD844_028635 [Phrynosoma platyrhinos]|uniref:Retroelement silencing factor 1 n=1 Tax=Phrynosoma platyrhinos TaxID=52577 RepID=A0ABQ7SI72_PHRPL|nr:hypothetical protein JD844_028635 [Phrynosoma platyrhinos]